MTTRHYENFPVASWLLPASKRPHVAAVYAFARSADDFSDEEKYRGRSLELLNQWREWLKGSDGVPSHPIFLALADTIRECRLPVQLLDDLLTAFTMDVTKRRYATWEELLTYCRYSANPVGRLVLTIFGIEDPKLHRLSDAICTGLQLANHWQDLAIDFGEKDRLYIPQDLMKKFGVAESDLARFLKTSQGQTLEGLTPLMEELVVRAEALFAEGEPLPEKVRGRLRLELKLTLLGGREILNQIQAAGYDPFRRRPVISTAKKLNLLAQALFS
ncbi:MAG: squalene synthase HpnC [Candidatus Omnitrophica bacterium]|nr:squalene synthase HpnC [Candidatus Omnitrophota bacterium]